jgi:hypothetical protein
VIGLPGEETAALRRISRSSRSSQFSRRSRRSSSRSAVVRPSLRRPGVQVGLADPLADRGLGQIQLAGDLPDGLAG